MSLILAVDVGGTFTDLVGIDLEKHDIISQKVLTSYPDPSASVRDSLDDPTFNLADAELLFHGTTVGINAIIERSGPPVALLTTAGFRDVLEIRRGSRSEMWNLHWQPLPPLIQRELRFEIAERTDARGVVLEPPDRDEIVGLVRRLKEQGVSSIAVFLLNSYINPENEVSVQQIINEVEPELLVSISSDLTRELGEYERTSTVAANAMLRPVIEAYLDRLSRFLEEREFAGTAYVMQSTGGVTTLSTSSQYPVLIVESGPAAGAAATAEVAVASGISSSISFDMGGTTAKACVVLEGLPQLTPSYKIGGGSGHVLQVPGVDIVEVGTGGGSIAFIDAAGALKVGPRSASSAPGPACYGLGGTEPTITDANLILGRIGAGGLVGGKMALDSSAAEAALGALAERLGYSVPEVAAGIIEIANVKMAGAVRRVTVERGLDPREFVLVGYGGAGPLHACDVARELHIPRVIIPPLPGHFSALGMLLTRLRRDYSRTLLTPLSNAGALERIRSAYDDMRAEAMRDLGELAATVQLELSADMRFVGQHHTVTVQLPSLDSTRLIAATFYDVFAREFAHEGGAAVELVTARVAAIAMRPGVDVAALRHGIEGESRRGRRTASVFFKASGYADVDVIDRSSLTESERISGPALIQEGASTTVLGDGDVLVVNQFGCLDINVAVSEELES